MGRRAALFLFLALVGLCGCTRDWYRRDADKEVYACINERNGDSWRLPRTDIDTAPASRLFDPGNPSCPPMPPDDPAAAWYMICADGHRGYPFWGRWGVTDTIENGTWPYALPREADGRVKLNPTDAVLLGQLNSREFQTALEQVYLTGLSLTLNRFEFDCQWFLLNSTFYDHFGSGSFPTERNTLTNSTNFGFTKAFTSGGQLLVNLANSFIFQYTGQDSYNISSGLSIAFLQPLMKNAGRDVRMEALTQGERTLLYAVRDFARFRKQFYFNLTTRDGGYLGLLLQLQNIRNQEENVRRLQQTYELHRELRDKGGSVSTVQVEQVFLQLQQGQASLLQSRTNLENSLDGYKFTLGLPPTIPIKLDDSLLDSFQLNSEAIIKLQEELNTLDLKLRQPEQAPPAAEIAQAFDQLIGYLERTQAADKLVQAELKRQLDESPTDSDRPEVKQERDDLTQVGMRLKDVSEELARLETELKMQRAEVKDAERNRDWERLQRGVRVLIALHADLLVYESQVRIYDVDLKKFPYTEPEAIAIALANRLDLMNERGRVVDAWRQIAVTANALEAGVNIVGSANLASQADANGILDFSSEVNSYRIGVELEGPLNRLAQRNTFRASLIQYERQRRTCQGRFDQVVQSLRRSLRQLETDRLNYEISRQSLIAAARQLEAARGRLLLGGDSSPQTSTLDTLNALSSLLQAKNTLIANWVNYETGRLQLLLDMEVLQLDDRGIYEEAGTFDTQPPPGPVERLPVPNGNTP